MTNVFLSSNKHKRGERLNFLKLRPQREAIFRSVTSLPRLRQSTLTCDDSLQDEVVSERHQRTFTHHSALENIKRFTKRQTGKHLTLSEAGQNRAESLSADQSLVRKLSGIDERRGEMS